MKFKLVSIEFYWNTAVLTRFWIFYGCFKCYDGEVESLWKKPYVPHPPKFKAFTIWPFVESFLMDLLCSIKAVSSTTEILTPKYQTLNNTIYLRNIQNKYVASIVLDNWAALLCGIVSHTPLQAKERFLVLEYSICMPSLHQQGWTLVAYEGYYSYMTKSTY